ncbi:MAG TPA: L,D-transpeptidase family protein [Sphingomonas sp.]|nr:L,D-transpeptidase family protein [Sphingomonas sp.]
MGAAALLLVAALTQFAARRPQPHVAAAKPPRPALSDRIFASAKQPLDLPGAVAPVRSLLAVSGPMRFGQSLWDETGVPPGPLWIRVDRDAQLISVFRGGHEIGTAVILYGAPEKPTPAGRYPILAKLRNHRSSLYEAEMPYTLRLTGDGVAIHASSIREGRATHGCIGVPEDFAAKLFEAAQTGDSVVIV